MDPTSSSQPVTPQGEPAGRPRVLAVDDQMDSLRLLQLRLQSAGMDCFTTTSGPAALKFLSTQLVDVIILDVMMPQMDGFEVCRRIKTDERIKDIPILFLTARMEAGDRIKGLEVGGHDYLSKPIDHHELLARTRAAIRVKHLQDQLKLQIFLQQRINQLHQEKISDHWEKTFGQLAASLAHEINNPLAAALGSVQLLTMDEGLHPDIRQRLQVVDQSLHRAGQKLRSLLLIAQTSPPGQSMPLRQLVEDLITLTNFSAVINKVNVTSEFYHEAEWQGSLTELARAALYVLNNAIEAAAGRPDGQVLIRVEQRGDFNCLSILDNGLGIPPENQGRMFEPFFTTKEPPHSGIGLYLASQIFRAAGGYVQFVSPLPTTTGGAEFILSLPATVTPSSLTYP